MFRVSPFLLLAATAPHLTAQLPTTSTVTVPGTAAIPTHPPSAGSTPAIDSGLGLSGLVAIQITVRGSEIAFFGATPNYANGCCFFAEFTDAAGVPILLDPLTYPANFWPAVPPSSFYPISGGPPAIPNDDTVFQSGALPVPANAVAIRFGHADTSHFDNSGSMTVTTSSAVVVTDLGGGCSLSLAALTCSPTVLGGTWAWSGFDFAPFAIGVRVVSFGGTPALPLGNCLAHVDLPNGLLDTVFTDGFGRWHASTTLPNDPMFAGMVLTMQAGVFAPGSTQNVLGLDLSDGLLLLLH
jgi:hypothetical protein